MKILVIDTDSARIHSLKALKSGGHLVQSFDSWSEARGLLDPVSFQILVLGPKQDFQAISEWRQSLEEKSSPLVVAIGPDPGAHDSAAGIDHYLETPLDEQSLPALLNLPDVFPEAEAIDLNAAVEVCDGDEDLFREIAGIFLREGPRRRDKMTRAFEGKDWKGVGEAAHLMKGSALNLAAGPLRLATKFLEQAAETGDRPRILFGCEQVEYEHQRLERHLRGWLETPGDAP